jgi:ferritin-like metal-binding protein YciE
VQALAQLRTAPDLAGDEQHAEAFRDHLHETKNHERLVRGLLEARDASPSQVKDAVMTLGGKGFLLFARLQPETPGKLQSHALSYEALEDASYELLLRVARQIAAEERAMIERLLGGVDRSAEASLRPSASPTWRSSSASTSRTRTRSKSRRPPCSNAARASPAAGGSPPSTPTTSRRRATTGSSSRSASPRSAATRRR